MDVARYTNLITKSQISQAVELLEYFDRIANKLCQDHSKSASTHHWSQRWLLPYLKRRKVVYVTDFRQAEAPFPCEYAPTDLGSSAAFWKLHWYLREIPESKPMDAERSTQLAICTATEVGIMNFCEHLDEWYLEWSVNEFASVETLMDLIRKGADPNCGISTSIWEEVLRFFYSKRLNLTGSSKDLVEDESIAEVHQCFLEAGAHPNPTLYFNLEWGITSSLLHVYFDLDTSLLPIIQTRKKDFVGSTTETETADIKPLAPSNRPLRFSIGMEIRDSNAISDYGFYGDGSKEAKEECIGMREVESENELETEGNSTRDANFQEPMVQIYRRGSMAYYTRVMTDAQVGELYGMLRGMLDMPERLKWRIRKWVSSRKPFLEWVHDMHKNCFAEIYDPGIWKDTEGYFGHFSSSLREDSEDSDYDD
ncbi:MAG: hypothetical protein LQ351_000294 [Letrouitia transgressa]|nr:MAG: hypothetical protein LQ351_000294 [Letrouitia transgressa]